MDKKFGVIILDKDGNVLLQKCKNKDEFRFLTVTESEVSGKENLVKNIINIDVTIYDKEKFLFDNTTYFLGRTKDLTEPMKDNEEQGFIWCPILLISKKINNKKLIEFWNDVYKKLPQVLGLKEEKSCGAIILNKDKKVLLVQQVKSKTWAFPKGHVEAGETEEETALREVKEETGIEIKVDTNKRYKLIYCQRTNILKEVVFFLATAVTENVNIDKNELGDYIWADLENVNNILTYKNLKQIFLEAKQDIDII